MVVYTTHRVPQNEVLSIRCCGEDHVGQLIRTAGCPDNPVWADEMLKRWLGEPFTFDGSMEAAGQAVCRLLQERHPEGTR